MDQGLGQGGAVVNGVEFAAQLVIQRPLPGRDEILGAGQQPAGRGDLVVRAAVHQVAPATAVAGHRRRAAGQGVQPAE